NTELALSVTSSGYAISAGIVVNLLKIRAYLENRTNISAFRILFHFRQQFRFPELNHVKILKNYEKPSTQTFLSGTAPVCNDLCFWLREQKQGGRYGQSLRCRQQKLDHRQRARCRRRQGKPNH